MAYKPDTFKDRAVQYPHRYTTDSGEQVTLERDPGDVYEEGTPVNASALNRLANGVWNARQIYFSTDNPTDGLSPGGAVTGDRYLSNKRFIAKPFKNLISDNLFEVSSWQASASPAGTISYAGTRVTVNQSFNSAISATYATYMYHSNQGVPSLHLIARHKYFICATGTPYRTAASGYFARSASAFLRLQTFAGSPSINLLDFLVYSYGNDYSTFVPLLADAISYSGGTVFTPDNDYDCMFEFRIRGGPSAAIGTGSTQTTLHEFGDIIIIDLTDAYGEGNEPELSECEDMFMGPATFQYTTYQRNFFENRQFLSRYFIQSQMLASSSYWQQYMLMSEEIKVYPNPSAGFTLQNNCIKYRRLGPLVYFEMAVTVTVATTANQVKALFVNSMLPQPAVDTKFACMSSVTGHQNFLQMVKSGDLTALNMQTVAIAAVNSVITASGVYLAADGGLSDRA